MYTFVINFYRQHVFCHHINHCNINKDAVKFLNHGRQVLIYLTHYGDVIMGAIASQITGLTIVYSTVYSGADQRKHQSSASLAFVRGIHRGPVNSPHKWPVTRKMFPFDDVITHCSWWHSNTISRRISSQAIEFIPLEYSGLSTRKLSFQSVCSLRG